MKSENEKILKSLVFKGKMGNLEKENEKRMGFKKGKGSGKRTSENPRTENGKGKIKGKFSERRI